jgi:hypothetical protein
MVFRRIIGAPFRGRLVLGYIRFILLLPFYQFTQPFVAVSPFSEDLLDFFDSFSV